MSVHRHEVQRRGACTIGAEMAGTGTSGAGAPTAAGPAQSEENELLQLQRGAARHGHPVSTPWPLEYLRRVGRARTDGKKTVKSVESVVKKSGICGKQLVKVVKVIWSKSIYDHEVILTNTNCTNLTNLRLIALLSLKATTKKSQTLTK